MKYIEGDSVIGEGTSKYYYEVHDVIDVEYREVQQDSQDGTTEDTKKVHSGTNNGFGILGQMAVHIWSIILVSMGIWFVCLGFLFLVLWTVL